MGEEFHKPGLYRWKRQEEPRAYSRSQKVKTDNDIHDWIKKVEDASNNAAEHVFGKSYTSGRLRGKAAARATRELLQDDEQAYTEAQDLLSQWMEEKVHLHGDTDLNIDCNYEDDSWQKHELQSDVKREWDNMLANNYEEYGLPVSSRSKKSSSDLYNLDEDDAVARVMRNMLDKPVVKKEFKKDLGLDKWGKQKDPRNKMDVRQQQVKENREKREAELLRKRTELQNKKDAMSQAKQLVLKEERGREMAGRREEMKIRKEMATIRKEMQEERVRVDEKKKRDREHHEEAVLAAHVQVAWEDTKEHEDTLEDQRRQEGKQRLLAHRLRELETREAAQNLKILHRHFSAWYNIVLDKRLKIGKARAMYDWKLLLRTWNAWRAYLRGQKVDRETKQYEVEVINTQRNKQKAETHSRLAVLRKYFVSWQVWVHSQQERRVLESAQTKTRSKMMSLLEAAASGKLGQGSHGGQGDTGSVVSTRSTPRDSGRRGNQDTNKPSTADKINALFQQTRNVSNHMSDSMSTERSDVSTAAGGHKVESRLPSEPWQVTRKHLQLSPAEMAELGGEPTCSPEEMNAKVLKKYGRQAWHKQEVSNFEHRHSNQKQILEEQKRQIMEQQRMIEELQFKSTHTELQKQLVEQKLVLQTIQQQVESGHDNNNNNGDIRNVKMDKKPGYKQSNVKTSVQPSKTATSKSTAVKPGSRPLSSGSTKQVANQSEANKGLGNDTARTGATTNRSTRPMSARTDVSRPASYTSSASEQTKYLQVLKNMDDRSAERARSKAEREEKRRIAEEQRLLQLEAEAEAVRRDDEAEKQARAKAYRERKRQEKEREAERQLCEEKLKQQTVAADLHYQRSLLKYHGLVPMKKLVAMAKKNDQIADSHQRQKLLKKVLLSWHQYVADQWREKEALATEMSNFLAVKHCYQNWRLYKHSMIIQEHKAVQHHRTMIKVKVFQTWRDYANEQKVASWEKERRAREHHRKLLLRRHFHAWRTLPEEVEREKDRERRRAELRQKVASILPDFSLSSSVEQSTDFTL